MRTPVYYNWRPRSRESAEILLVGDRFDNDERDQQSEQHERFDQRERDDHKRLNRSGCARITLQRTTTSAPFYGMRVTRAKRLTRSAAQLAATVRCQARDSIWLSLFSDRDTFSLHSMRIATF